MSLSSSLGTCLCVTLAGGISAVSSLQLFNAVDPPVGGVSVEVDAQDRLRMEIASCGARVDSVELRELGAGDSEGRVVGTWSVLTQSDEGTLVLPAAVGWHVERDPGPLEPDGRYAVSATYVVGGRTDVTVFRPREVADDGGGAVSADPSPCDA